MKTFSSLLDFSVTQPPAKTQEAARKEFPNRVAGSRLALRRPVGPIQPAGVQIVIGVTTYSQPDLALLDELEASLDQGALDSVEVFDVLECRHMQDFEKFIPGISPVYRTPVVAVIADGKLVEQATGLSCVKETLLRRNVLHE